MTIPTQTFLLYADIVGYTKLMRADKDDALAKLEQFKAVLQSQTDAHQGEVLQFQRDNCLVAFTNVADAVACAEALQMNFKAEPAVPVRMGIHAGEVVVENGNAFGEGVLEVTQLERTAIAGSVVLSKAIKEQIADNDQFALESLGAFTFKNVDKPIELFALTNDGLTVPESSAELQEEQKQANRKRWFRAAQLFAGYLVAAWTIVQFVDWILTRYEVSPYWTDILLWTFVGVIPSLLIYLVHQDRFHQRVLLRREKIIIPLNILLLFGALTVAYGGADLGSITKTVSFTDADGNAITQTVVKREFRIEVPIFPFEQMEGPDSTTWMQLAISGSIWGDLSQDTYLSPRARTEQELVEKINVAKTASGKYFVDGSYRVLEDGFEIKPALRDKTSGNLVEERIFRGEDFFVLIDSIGIYLRQALGLTPEQMDASINLKSRDLGANNLEALKYLVNAAYTENPSDYEKAIELDSTSVPASLFYAQLLYVYSSGQLEAELAIARAMRHRKKVGLALQTEIMVVNHLIHEEYEKAEKLLNIQLELDPGNPDFLRLLVLLYSRTGQFEKLATVAEKRYEYDPSPGNRMAMARAALNIGEAKQVEREARLLLNVFPRNIYILEILAEAYMLQQEYDAAQETLERIILINPEVEQTLSKTLDAIAWLKQNPVNKEELLRMEGKYRSQDNETLMNYQLLNNFIFSKSKNQVGVYVYPAGKELLLIGRSTLSQEKRFLVNERGDIYAVKRTETVLGKYTADYYYWKQDALIWRAEELLRKRDYAQALPAYEAAIARHPEHFYLYEAKKHIEYMQSKTEEEIMQLYLRYVGDYGEVRIWIEDGQLFYKRPGVARRIFRPVSDHEFMTLNRYMSIYGFEVENGVVKGIYINEYDRESQTWPRDEDYYHARTKLVD